MPRTLLATFLAVVLVVAHFRRRWEVMEVGHSLGAEEDSRQVEVGRRDLWKVARNRAGLGVQMVAKQIQFSAATAALDDHD